MPPYLFATCKVYAFFGKKMIFGSKIQNSRQIFSSCWKPKLLDRATDLHTSKRWHQCGWALRQPLCPNPYMTIWMISTFLLPLLALRAAALNHIQTQKGRFWLGGGIQMSMTLIWYTEVWNKPFNHLLTRVDLLYLCWVFTHFVTGCCIINPILVSLYLYTVSHDVCHTSHSDTEKSKVVVFTCFFDSVWCNPCFSRLCFFPKKKVD